jgi:signal transduction histidine kinase
MTQPNLRDNLVSPDDPARALRRAERLLGCFQQALGHELPNRLVAIQGMARLVEADAAAVLNLEARACLDRLAESTQRTLDFVKALADVGRACRKKEPAAEVSLAELWRETTAEMNWLCQGRAVSYHSIVPLPLMFVPPANARRVLVEILRAIVRRCPAEQPLRVEVRATRSAGVIEVQVADDGPALSPLQQQQAFDPVLGSETEPADELGLFLTRQLVEGWGGNLRLEAGPHGGCVAAFTALARREDLPT